MRKPQVHEYPETARRQDRLPGPRSESTPAEQKTVPDSERDSQGQIHRVRTRVPAEEHGAPFAHRRPEDEARGDHEVKNQPEDRVATRRPVGAGAAAALGLRHLCVATGHRLSLSSRGSASRHISHMRSVQR